MNDEKVQYDESNVYLSYNIHIPSISHQSIDSNVIFLSKSCRNPYTDNIHNSLESHISGDMNQQLGYS